MSGNSRGRPSIPIWERKRGTVTAAANPHLFLGAASSLPIRYWKPFFFFKGMPDEVMRDLSAGQFPKTTHPGKTHPIISLKPLPDNVGFKVSPCSSKRAFDIKGQHYIRKGCQLLHKNWETDRPTYVVEAIEVPIPPSIGSKLRFMGEVPVECIQRLPS